MVTDGVKGIMKNLGALLVLVILVLVLGCQQENRAATTPGTVPTPTKIVVTATPDIGATVTALVEQRSGGPRSSPTPWPTPDIEATVEARIEATIEAMSTDIPAPTNVSTHPAPTATILAVTEISLSSLKYDKDLLLFGPQKGKVTHQTWNNSVEVFHGVVARQDVLVEAEFRVPQVAAGKHWEHGFLLKYGGGNNLYWVSLHSLGNWTYFHRLGDSEKLGEKTQRSPDIGLEPGDSNLLQAALVGDQAWVYINGRYQGNLSLDEDTGGDRVAIFADDETEGETFFEDFTVWKWDPGMSQHFTETGQIADSGESGSSPVVPTEVPTIVPVETASKVSRTVVTSMGRQVDLTVEGFTDNRLRFDQLIQVINEEEQLLDVPFPAPRLNMRRVSKLPAGFCGDNQLSYEPRYQGDPYTVEASVIRLRVDSDCDDTFGSMAHEVAHTWFRGNDPANWIDEGLANSIEYQVKEANSRDTKGYPPVTYCASHRNINELERAVPAKGLSVEASGFRCNYRLGDGLFGALKEHYSNDDFNRRIATLVRRSMNATNRAHSVEDVREALGPDGKPLEIIDLWYHGAPDMRIYRHLDLVTYTHPPTIDGEYLHWAGRIEEPGVVHDFILGDASYCSQFFLYEGLAEPEPLAGIADPVAVGWRHDQIPDIVAINSKITPETGEFSVTARVNARDLPMAKDLSLRVSSRVTTRPDGQCAESANYSQVEVVHGTLAEELKGVTHYHMDSIAWNQIPEVRDYRIRLSGTAQPGTLSFEWREGLCSQFLFYELNVAGYRYIDTVRPMLPEGYSWDDPSRAEVTEANTNADGSFEAVIEIWDKDLLGYDQLVLVVRAESVSGKALNQCSRSEILAAVTVKSGE